MRQVRWVMVVAAVWVGGGCQPARSASAPPSLPAPSTQPAGDEATTRPVAPPVVQPVTLDAQDAATTQPTVETGAGTTTQPVDAASTTTRPAVEATQPTTDSVTTQPATAIVEVGGPTTAAATQPESAKTALAAMMNASVRGDVDGVRRRLYVEGDEAGRMAAAMVEVAEAAKTFRDAAAAKFGWPQLRVLDIEIVPPLLLAGATETVDGDRATVQFPGQASGTNMRQVDGTWKLSVPELVEAQKRSRDIEQVIQDAREPADRFLALAKRVDAGEFQTVEQVQQALAKSLFASNEERK